MAKIILDDEIMEDLMSAESNIQDLLLASNTPKLRHVVKDAFHKNALKERNQQKVNAEVKNEVKIEK